MNSMNHRQTEKSSRGPVGANTGLHWSSHVTRRVAAMDRGSARLVQRASDVGVTITYVGMSELFDKPRAYGGSQTDWVIAPATNSTDAIIPRSERGNLQRLNHAGIDFPLVYVAHEISKGQLGLPTSTTNMTRPEPTTLDWAIAAQAVGPVPPANDATALAERLGRSSQRLLTTLGKALPIVGSIVAAPFLIAGAAVGALAAGLDPIVFGVIPAGRPVPGEPGAWYVLARWEWPSGTGSYPASTSTSPAG